MPNYDFHNIFSPSEFELFVRDILEEREKKEFETFREGKDGGVDLRHISLTGVVTIVQVKRYKSSFSQLKRTLINYEIPNVKREKPDRYILVTSIPYTKKERNEILNLFESFIKSPNDIIGRDELNKYLGLEAYHKVEKKHFKLWLTSTNILQSLLQKEIYNVELNQSKFELERIIDPKRIRLYAQNNSFIKALNILENNNVVLITGLPGIGKTTLARQLVLYYLKSNQKKTQYQFIAINSSVIEGERLFRYNEKQIFLFDDFWGQIFKDKWRINEDKRFLNFVEKIRTSNNKKLILTTRDYVLKQGLKSYRTIGLKTGFAKYIIDPSEYTKKIKAKILYNHLYWSTLSLPIITEFIEQKKFIEIINHPNYSPRLIEVFIQTASRNSYRSYEFHHRFLEYLKNPYDFWEETFEKQTTASQFLLLILFISNTPMLQSSLLKTYNSIVKLRIDYGFEISIKDFKQSLKELENTFIVTSPFFIENEFKIEFINPSIKDFLLEYLRKNIEIYGEILIKGATFYNQLIFAFHTFDDQNINDYDIDNPLFGKKITLNDVLIDVFKNKILTDFYTLTYSKIENRDYAGYTLFNKIEDILVINLIRLTNYFDIHQDIEVRSLLVYNFNEIFASYKEGQKLLPKEGMENLPNLLKKFFPYIKINIGRFLRAFYDSCGFTSELLSFSEFKEIFPSEYDKFIDEHLNSIHRKVKEVILDDADYYLSNLQEVELDMLIDYYYEEVFKAFGIEETDDFLDKLLLAAEKGIYGPNQEKNTNLKNLFSEYEEDQETEEEISKDFQSLIGKEENDLIDDDLYEKELEDYIRRNVPKNASIFLSLWEKQAFRFLPLMDTIPTLDLFINFFSIYNKLPSNKSILFDFMLSEYIEDKTNHNENVSKAILKDFIFHIAYSSFCQAQKSFSEDILLSMWEKYCSKKEIKTKKIKNFYPILIKKQRWYEFFHVEFQIYLVVKSLSNLSNHKKVSFFKSKLNELYDEYPYEITCLWQFCYDLEKSDFIKYFALPKLIEIKDSIVVTSDFQLCKSFFELFELKFSLTFEDDEMRENLEPSSMSSTNSHYGEILRFFNIRLNIDDIDLFFVNAYNYEENEEIVINDYNGIKGELLEYLEKNCKGEEFSMYSKKNVLAYNIDPTQFINDKHFFELIIKLNVVEYLNLGYRQLQNKISELNHTMKKALNIN